MALNYPKLTVEIGGVTVPPATEWVDVKVESVFGEVEQGATDEIQGRAIVDNLTFVNEAAGMIDEAIGQGLAASGGGIFVGLPLELGLTDGVSRLELFKGYIDLASGLSKMTSNKYVTRVVELRSLDDIERKLSALTYGYLYDIGHVNSTHFREVDYVVEKDDTFVEQAMLYIVTFMMVRELRAQIQRVGTAINNVISLAVSSTTSSFAALLLAGLLLILELAYAAALIIAIKNMMEQIINNLVPITRKHKSITMFQALSTMFSYIGYVFKTTPELTTYLNNVTYVPSKSQGTDFIPRRSNSGIPTSGDYGYNCKEMYDLSKMICNGRYFVDGEDVYLYSKGDNFWRTVSGYVMPDMFFEREPVNYNSADMNGTELLTFTVDSSDFWTVENFTGTNYELTITNIGAPSQEYNLIRGYSEMRIPCALGNRKSTLTVLEKLISEVGFVVDSMVKVFGGHTNFGTQVRNRRGLMKAGTKYHVIPKLVYMEGRFMPEDHRAKFSAKTIYDNYYAWDSFADPDYLGQKRVYSNVTLPMGYVAFLKASASKYFMTGSGQEGEWRSIRWNFARDKAECDFTIRQIYTKNINITGSEG